ncbi:NF041680 family putative transposase [Nocardia sp. NPDC052278]|uniref:NF041680 family putative transposase n=1 Tax=unclassified Nocardia TaxID=2637762 RepID=UPI0036C4FE3A
MSSVESTRSFDLNCLAVFRNSFYDCLDRRCDALFELTDTVLCSDGPVHTLVGLSLAAEHRRGHGALYDGLGSGRIDFARPRRSLAALSVPRDGDSRILLTVDVSPWLRPDAATSPDRAFCHVYGRGKGQAQMIPGWPYSFVAALEPGRTSWTAIVDAVRIDPDDDPTTVTSTQFREVVDQLRVAGQHRPEDPAILIVFDAGYDITRLEYLLADLPVELVGRISSDRVLALPASAPPAARTERPAKHGPEFALAEVTTRTDTDRYVLAEASAWHRLHPMLKHRGNWADHTGPLPTIEGTLLRLRVQYLPGDHNPKPVWLWCSDPEATAAEVDRYWRTFLHRFDIEHTFRFFKQTLGWTRPHLRDPHAADRWTWLVIAAHTQLRLARNLTRDLSRPWENQPPDPIGSPRRESVEGFGTSARQQPYPPEHPNPPAPAPDAHPAPKTSNPPHTNQ